MNKVAVITGSAKGLGRAIALALADWGFTCVIHYRTSKKEAAEVLKQVQKKAPDAIALSADLRNEKEVDRLFKKIFKKFKKVDLLVNNVGDFVYREFSKTTNSQFVDLLESNIYSTLFCSRALLPSMRREKSGHIINIGVVGADHLNLLEKSAPYFFSKNGVYLLTKMMAHEEAKYGIHVNMISPASLETDIFKRIDFPMRRSASYEYVIKVLEFLISDKAYYINGANIEVAGGFVPGMK